MASQTFTLDAPFLGHRETFTTWPDGTVEVVQMAFIGHPESRWLPVGHSRRLPIGEARQQWRKLRQAGWKPLT